MEAYQFRNKNFFEHGIEKAKLIQVFDGDTAKFEVSGRSIMVRFLAINAPENTKRVEPYGAEAVQFVIDRLTNAKVIVLESDAQTPELDSTKHRYLCYVWYGESETSLKMLNLELVEASLAKLLIMSNVTKYNLEFEKAYRIVKKEGKLIHGELDKSFQSIYKSVTPSDIVNNIAEFDGKTLQVTGIVTRMIAQCFFVTDNERGVYVYNTYYNVSNIKPGDKITFVAQFSLDPVYGAQLTNIRGVNVLEEDCTFIIPALKDIVEIEKHIGQVVYLNNFYITAITNINKRTKAFNIEGILGKASIKLRMGTGVNPFPKKSAFKIHGSYNLLVGIISYRQTFEKEREPLYIFCNKFEEDCELLDE